MKKEIRELKKQRDELLEALKEIAKGEGAYSFDPHTHAQNTIQNMKEIANNAINQTQ